jgi:hypothetical protein
MGFINALFTRGSRLETQPEESAETKRGKMQRVLINQFFGEVSSLVYDQKHVFASVLCIWLGANDYTKELRKIMEETVAMSPNLQSGDQYRALLKSKSHERFIHHFRAMILLQALVSMRAQVELDEYESFYKDCLRKYENDYVYCGIRFHGKDTIYVPTKANGVFQKHKELYDARGEHQPHYRMAHTFLELYFPPSIYQADLLPVAVLIQITEEFKGFVKWADSLAKAAVPAVKEWYGTTAKESAPKIKQAYQL